MPNGYDTLLGENGVKLSGGERQRVCIARAILKDAPIIVFDEATSFTDIENEHRIQLALSHLLTNKTCIMIAHRLHTIVHADQICVFDHGRLRERGTHDSLIKQDGAYARMWDAYTHRTEKRSRWHDNAHQNRPNRSGRQSQDPRAAHRAFLRGLALHMGMFAVMIAAIINLVAGAFNAELLAFYSGALVVLFVVRAALYATNYAQTQFRGADITADLRLSIGNHLRRLNLGYFDKNSIGQLASVLTTDVSDFEQTITTSLASFFKVVCFSVLACAFAFAINWLYGLIILAIVVASLPLARLGGRAASKGGVRYRESVHAVISASSSTSTASRRSSSTISPAGASSGSTAASPI
ncbi:MAG: ABC transporter transmembrane domain-containing protein [Eggerthellaceae bacterium]